MEFTVVPRSTESQIIYYGEVIFSNKLTTLTLRIKYIYTHARTHAKHIAVETFQFEFESRYDRANTEDKDVFYTRYLT